jgi:predicted nucleic-acid-binding protein
LIALDTNVLVRFLIADDPEESRLAVELFAASHREGVDLFVGVVVLCETIWVLRSLYRVAKAEVVAALRGVLGSSHLVVEERDRVLAALESYSAGPGDFADFVVRESALAAGCSSVATFERDLWNRRGAPFISPAEAIQTVRGRRH